MEGSTTLINDTPFFLGKGNTGNSTQEVVEDPTVDTLDGAGPIHDTTKFVDDAHLVKRDLSHVSHVDESYLAINDTDFLEQSIKSFLEKPIVLATGTFSTTDTYSFLNNYSMPYAAFASSQGIVWTQKLAGIFGIRMDMRFRIVVNANRFQQGRYCIGWVPLAGCLKSLSSFKELNFNNSHMATLVQRTTVPHVELDLCNDTAAELEVPYVSSRNFYELNSILASSNEYPLGYLNVYPYSPLVSPAGSTTAGYTLYVSFHNIRLFGAASAQSGKIRGSDYGTKEISNKANGPISSVSTAISRGFKEFAQIPLLSSYANSVAWIADRITGVATVFGWSKPNQGDSLMKVMLLQAPGHNTVDGDSDARPLSYLSKPGVTKLDGVSGTEFDEMDFSYIVRKPAWFLTSTWTTSNTVGTTISTISVYPGVGQLSIGGAIHFAPVSFVANFFREWRGSLRYRLKFVRTEFHSGRLQVAFYPGTTTTTYTGNAAYVHRMIIDIREHPEVDFVVPFISATTWNGNGSPTGTIVISVADPLVAPATVASSVNILVEIAGGEDMEFAIPNIIGIVPTTFAPQSGKIGSNDNRLITMNIGSSTIAANPHVSSALTIGDKVSSFRAYLKRYHPLIPSDLSLTSTIVPNFSTVTMYPDVIFGVNATSLPTAGFIRSDMVGIIASCYAVWRGGVRIRDVVNKGMLVNGATSFNTPSLAKVSAKPILSTGFSLTGLDNGTATGEVGVNAHQQFQDLRNNGVVSVEIPQYTHVLARSVVDAMTYQGTSVALGGGIASGLDGSLTKQTVLIGLPTTNTTSVTAVAGQSVHNVFRALADDGDFGCFISVPAMYNTSASAGFPAFY